MTRRRRVAGARGVLARVAILARIAVLAIVAVTGVVATPLTDAWAAGDIRIETEAILTVQPTEARVRVETSLRVTNTTTDRVDGGQVLRRFFTGFEIGVPGEARGASASQDGSPVGVRLRSTEEPFVAAAAIEFNQNLFGGETTTIRLSYDLPSAPPRTDSVTRVSPAHLSFFVWQGGDPGLTTVRVVVPEAYDLEVIGEEYESRRRDDGARVIEAIGIQNPDTWGLTILGNDADRLGRRTAEADGEVVDISYFPGDEEWAEFVADGVATRLPELKELIGVDRPGRSRLGIVETVSPYFYGYAGWYLTEANRVEMGEELELAVLLHELSHAWFNEELFDDRWLLEGLAEHFARLALPDAGETPPPLGAESAPFPLDEWDSPGSLTEVDPTRESYGYETSREVIDRVAADIGLDGLQRVLAAAFNEVIAYTGDDPDERHEPFRDWRRFLDLVEGVGGAGSEIELFADLVAPADQRPVIEERTAARERYAELDAADEGWAPPSGVRKAMSRWRFGQAVTLIDEARAVATTAREVREIAGRLDLDVPADLENAYEESGDEMSRAQGMAATLLESVETLATAHDDVEADRTFTQRVGLWFDDPEDDLDQADIAFEAGDVERARSAAAVVSDDMAEASSRGRQRLSIAVGGLVALMILLLGVRVVRRRRKRGAVGSAPVTSPPPGGSEVSDASASFLALFLPSRRPAGAHPDPRRRDGPHPRVLRMAGAA